MFLLMFLIYVVQAKKYPHRRGYAENGIPLRGFFAPLRLSGEGL